MNRPTWRDIREFAPVSKPREPRMAFMKGSRPRCVRLVEHTQTDRHGTAGHLSRVLLDTPSEISQHDHWMPFGLPAQTRSKLPNTIASGEVDLTRPNPFLTLQESSQLATWWFGPVKEGHASHSDESTAPTWDLVATRGSRGPWETRPRGLVLVEAKAHHEEPFSRTSTTSGGHQAIVINEILGAHSKIFTAGAQYDPAIYQLLNRFAFGLKLAEIGFEVELVFLGFLNAAEMPIPFRSSEEWERHIIETGEPAVLPEIWRALATPVGSNGGSFRARIRSTIVGL
jgi:hypothetical protein